MYMLSDAPLCNFSTLLAAVHGAAVHHGHKTKGWPAIAVRDCKLKFLKVVPLLPPQEVGGDGGGAKFTGAPQ